jgi:sn-glycerol 3-phosphate transport system ATP-binding protein
MASIELSSVKKVYGGRDAVPAVNDLSLTIPDGQLLVLVGPSGCGKSTLLRMIAGLEQTTGGTISIGGEVVNEREPAERDIAMVFQNYALYPHMSVRQNLEYGLKNRGTPRARSSPRRRGCPHSRDRALARAPPAPAFGWPAPARCDGAGHRPQAEGVPVRRAAQQSRRQAARPDADRDRACSATWRPPSVYVTHDQLEAMTLADRLVVMNGGRIEQVGHQSSCTSGRDAVRRRLHRLAADEPARRRRSTRPAEGAPTEGWRKRRETDNQRPVVSRRAGAAD